MVDKANAKINLEPEEVILIFSPEKSKRLEYAAEVVFRHVLQVDSKVQITNLTEDFLKHTAPKINYSDIKLNSGLHIPPSGLLFQTGIKPVFPGLTYAEYGKAIFPVDGSEDVDYDIFSAVFFMVTRYEEYLPHEKDQHGRYNPENSFAYQHNFLDKPMVHYWCEELKDKLQYKYPQFRFPVKRFRAEMTIDVDNGYAYFGKGIIRTIGGYGKDMLKGKFRSMEERTHVLTTNKKDPFDYYKFQKKIAEKYHVPLRYFVLTALKKTEFDHNIDVYSRTFRKLVKKINKSGKLGIHPSYYSKENSTMLESEIKQLKEVSKKLKINSSRQHFLNVTYPDTFENLIRAGIEKDYTMGYATQPGFRAGIAEPYPFYNLTEERKTSLMIYPFQVMDSTYQDYLKYNAEDAIIHINKLMEEVKKVSGLFIAVFHDRSFAPWKQYKGWKQVFVEIIRLASRK